MTNQQAPSESDLEKEFDELACWEECCFCGTDRCNDHANNTIQLKAFIRKVRAEAVEEERKRILGVLANIVIKGRPAFSASEIKEFLDPK